MEFVNGKDDIPYMKWKKCSKPPISQYIDPIIINQLVPLNVKFTFFRFWKHGERCEENRSDPNTWDNFTSEILGGLRKSA